MNRVYDGIMGLVVGDALGVPVEFCERDTFCVTDMTGGGTHGLPAGTWSDDGSLALATLESLGRRRRIDLRDLALATLESLGRRRRIDLRDIMDNFVRWYAHNEFTPYHSVFDIGNTTRKAIGLYMQGVGVESCGLMRILPLAFVPHTDEDVAAVSALTHAHPISTGACEEYVRIAELLLAGGGPEEAARLYDDEYDIRRGCPKRRLRARHARRGGVVLCDDLVVPRMRAEGRQPRRGHGYDGRRRRRAGGHLLRLVGRARHSAGVAGADCARRVDSGALRGGFF